MEYRPVERTGWNVSALAFGCMRFKDEDSAVEAVHKAVELGVNYFDVAPAYCKERSESWLGAALEGLDRSQLIVTAKSSPGNGGVEIGEFQPNRGFGIRAADDARRQIERSMKVLGVDHLDMYQFWAVHSEDVFQEGIKKGGFLEGVLLAKEEGLFDYLGLTTHGQDDETLHYLQDSPCEFDMVTIPFHLADARRVRTVEYCAERGIGIVAMNPLAGGRLARSAPVLASIAEELGFASLVEPALRFTAHYPGVTAALNGISYSNHAVQGAAAVEKGPLPENVLDALRKRLDELFANVSLKHLCTACGYCGECPQGILIPQVLEAFINLRIPSLSEETRAQIAALTREEEPGWDPSLCTACGECQSRCPNKIPIVELMAEAAQSWPSKTL
ncbi:aldo/keto reductase [Candidatus Sumerlaeota bacterium]|nr:aldo/keto reductase [Candidatus Sumerlaeota bacterium]